ncbi:MAG: LON peptidase substrate-binding domain-containing protein, partial [Planctomycetota bacterium]
MSTAHLGSGSEGGSGREVAAVQLESSVVFPSDVVSIQLPEEDPVALLLKGRDEESVVACVFPVRGRARPRQLEDVHPVAVLCRVVQHMQLPRGDVQAVFQGLARARVLSLRADGDAAWVACETLPADAAGGDGAENAVLEVLDLVSELVPRDGGYPEDLESILRMNLRGAGRFADLVAAYLHLPVAVKREIAVSLDPARRLAVLAGAIREELQRHAVDNDIHKQVRQQMEQRQKEQYLRQQIRAIRRELGDEGAPDDETDELLERLGSAGLPKEARQVAEREIRRLASVSPSSAEYQVIRTYVGWLLELPWKKRTRDRLRVAQARKILDARHAGLEKVKERILEHLAVRSLNKGMRGPILCLVGPPGVGK